ncbi:MAG TPA: hypothetical protein VFU35_02035 [Jatrophihabitans sp.]|nr:hypothetical protein [Jatrophihabitans sp.]
MAHLICPDVSEFQRPLDHTYGRDFIIFRVTFGANYLDPHFLANANAVKRLHDQGKVAGVLLYTVYTSSPVKAQFDAVWKAIGPKVPSWLTGIMLDVETWRGKSYELSGNHSKRINQLYGLHAHRMRSWQSVIAYGNAGDLAELYPGRDRRCRVIVASYGPQLTYKKVRGAIGQQYSDGQPKWRVPRLGGKALPRASTPFGPCDHNVFPGLPDAKALIKLLRPTQLAHAASHPKPPVVTLAKPAVKPKVAAPAPHYNVKRGNSLVSADGAHALFLKDDGTLEIRHNGAHEGTVLKGA